MIVERYEHPEHGNCFLNQRDMNCYSLFCATHVLMEWYNMDFQTIQSSVKELGCIRTGELLCD